MSYVVYMATSTTDGLLRILFVMVVYLFESLCDNRDAVPLTVVSVGPRGANESGEKYRRS